VTGLTTAATLWIVATIGMAIGFGALVEAVGTTLLVLIALVPVGERAGGPDPARSHPLRSRSEIDVQCVAETRRLVVVVLNGLDDVPQRRAEERTSHRDFRRSSICWRALPVVRLLTWTWGRHAFSPSSQPVSQLSSASSRS
jgi:uncharacterized membrane protein YhiD involved in acid resistance